MAVEGEIADRTKAIMPITWDALSKDTRYGEELLRKTIDTVKERIMGEVIDPENEASYPLVVIDYLSKLSAIELINPGIDFWMSQPVSTTTTGTAEEVSYPSRTTELRNLRTNLLAEVKRLEPEVIPLIDYKRVSRAPRASSSTQNDPFITPSPQEFPRPFGSTSFS
jgi:hypothetical protein